MIIIILLIIIFLFFYKKELFTDTQFKTYVINLKNRPDRKNKMTHILNNVNIQPTFIDAIDGNQLNIQQLVKENKLTINPKKRTLRRGEIGCFLSHMKAWEQIANSNNDFGLILEDDVTISVNFKERCEVLLDKLKNIEWDMLYVGRNCVNFFKDLCTIGVSIDDDLFKPYYVGYGAYSYFMTKKCAKYLLSIAMPFDIPVDVFFHDIHQENKTIVYVSKNILAMVEDITDSDTVKII